MTTKEFWENIDNSLGGQIGESEAFKEQFIKRLTKILVTRADDISPLKGDDRRDFLKRVFKKAGYNDYWNLVLDGFDKMLEFQNKFWDENTTKPTNLSRNNENLLALEEVRFETFGDLGKKGVAALDKEFTRAVKEDLDKADFTKNLEKLGGKIGQFAGVIADTSLRGWDRSVTNLKAEIAGIEKATFDGPPPIHTSHEFCINNYKKTYTRLEIENLTNGTLEPVEIYGGGYRCRHRWRWRVRGILKK